MIFYFVDMNMHNLTINQFHLGLQPIQYMYMYMYIYMYVSNNNGKDCNEME